MNESAVRHPWDEPAWRERVRELGAALGMCPEYHPLLVLALTHRSYAEAAPHGHNERLEFLGDSVVALVVNHHLFETFPEYAEGQLTKLKARYVCEPALASAAAALDLGGRLAMAPGDEAAGGRSRASTLSDAFEAVLAALYLARGLEAAREFVRRELIDRTDPHGVWDYKSRLQELIQERQRATPAYETEVESGPAHDRVFASRVFVAGEAIGEGTGRSKKHAEQAAAEDALARLLASSEG